VKRIHLIDFRGCLVSADYKADWDNELHPTLQRFGRVFDQRWIPPLD
jgi:hypothetical protein